MNTALVSLATDDQLSSYIDVTCFLGNQPNSKTRNPTETPRPEKPDYEDRPNYCHRLKRR